MSRRRSTASRMVLRAVSTPMLVSVPQMSLSMLAGMPMTGTLHPVQGEGPAQAAVAADDDDAFDAVFIEAAPALALPLRGLEFFVAGGLQDGAAALQDATDFAAV